MQRTQPTARPSKRQTPPANPSRDPALWPALGVARHLAVVLGLGALALLAFSNTLHNTDFALDNKFIIKEDPRLRQATAENLGLIFTQDYWWPKAVSGLYRPLTTLSFLFNYAILGNGEHAAGYHWVNLLLHWFNAVLLYFMALLLLQKLWPAVFTAALFATHPIVTECVSNIVGRSDLFATAAIIGGFLCYAKSTTLDGRRKLPWLLLLMVVTALGVFFKESAVMVLGVMVLYDFTYRLERLRANKLLNLLANFWRFFLKGYIAALPPLIAVAAVRTWVFGQLRPAEWPFVDNPLVSVSTWIGGNYYDTSLVGWLTAIKVIGKYVWLLLWPQKLSCDYSYDQVPLVELSFRRAADWGAILALVIVLAAIAAAVRHYRRNPAVFFFTMFFFLSLLPTSNLIIVTGAIMAERFLYLPSIGFAGVAVIAVYAVCRRMIERWRTAGGAEAIPPSVAAGAVLGLVVLACGARTYARNFDWENDVQLWTHDVQVCPDSFKTHKSLAFALYERDQQKDPPSFPDIDRIIAEGEKSRAILEKRSLSALDRASIVYLHLGAYYQIKANIIAEHNPASARFWYQKSVEALNVGVLSDHAFNEDTRRKELARGRAPDGIADVGNDQIYSNLGLAYMRLGEYQNALDVYSYMRHLVPNNSDAYLDIASVYLSSGHASEAIVPLMEVLLLDGSRKDALQSLIDILHRMDHEGCAVVTSEGRPRLNADCALVHDYVCAALSDLARVFTDAKQFDLAQRMTQNAVQKYRCSPADLQQPVQHH